MKSTHLAAASSFVLSLAMAAPALAAEQQTQGSEAHQSQLNVQKSDTSESGMEQSKSWNTQGEQGWTAKKRAEEISGTEVVNDSGQKIGEAESVVRERSTDEMDAVVSVGGFLGIGSKDVTIPLRDLRMEGDRLVAPIASTEKELKARRTY
jgi:hypothetical protein